jgi:hypothetical protein
MELLRSDTHVEFAEAGQLRELIGIGQNVPGREAWAHTSMHGAQKQ